MYFSRQSSHRSQACRQTSTPSSSAIFPRAVREAWWRVSRQRLHEARLLVRALWRPVDCAPIGDPSDGNQCRACGGKRWPRHVRVEFGRNRVVKETRRGDHEAGVWALVVEKWRETGCVQSTNVWVKYNDDACVCARARYACARARYACARARYACARARHACARARHACARAWYARSRL